MPLLIVFEGEMVMVAVSSLQGLALLHKMQAALGGTDKLAGANDFDKTVKAQIWNNAGMPTGEVWKRVRWMRNPNICG